MLTTEQKTILEGIFSVKVLKELSLSEAGKISEQTGISLRAVEWFSLGKGIWPCRYQRNVDTLNAREQQKLLAGKVLVVGLGGLGGQVVELLSRIGVGEIVGVDPDVFDQTNLNRQILASEENLGQTKSGEAQKRVRQINQAVEVTCYTEPFEELPPSAWDSVEIVFDCLGTIQDKLALSQKCSLENIPLIHGAIAGWYAQIAVIWPGEKTLEKIYRPQSIGLEKQAGTIAFTAATAAGFMVARGMKILTGKDVSRKTNVFFIDLLENELL